MPHAHTRPPLSWAQNVERRGKSAKVKDKKEASARVRLHVLHLFFPRVTRPEPRVSFCFPVFSSLACLRTCNLWPPNVTPRLAVLSPAPPATGGGRIHPTPPPGRRPRKPVRNVDVLSASVAQWASTPITPIRAGKPSGSLASALLGHADEGFEAFLPADDVFQSDR